MLHPPFPLLSSPTPLLPLLSHAFTVESPPFRSRRLSSTLHAWTPLPPLNSFFVSALTPAHLLHSSSSTRAGVEVGAITESTPDDSEFIEIGYISNVHGLNGGVKVKPSTDFPELRFSEPGTRWLRLRISGKETIREVELIEGRGRSGQKSWILRFEGIDTVDKARYIVGSTVLVREADRPALEDGEFYSADLVGMRVVLKETGKLVGTVVNVFNSGASDLLQVMLSSTEGEFDHHSSLEAKRDAPPALIWVPFVEAIVPDVDLNKREMQITPPEGLLELNIRTDMKSKKERRQLVWKQRMKAQKHFILAKRKLNELGQCHLLQGLSSGDKAQNNLLRNQIMGINFKLFKQAIQNIEMLFHSHNMTDFVTAANSSKLLDNALRFSNEENHGSNHGMHARGLHLMSEGKVGIILVNTSNLGIDYGSNPVGSGNIQHPSNALFIQEFLSDKMFSTMREEQCASIPLIIISTAHDIKSCQLLLSENDYYGFDPKKIWFLEEERLPIVSSSLSEERTHKILQKTPWEILQSPVGSGGVISVLSSGDIIDVIAEMGVKYVEVRSLQQRCSSWHLPSFGFIELSNADIGVKIVDKKLDDSSLDIIFSMRFLKDVSKGIGKLEFHAVPVCHSHIEKVDKEWVEIHPTSPNSYELRCSIYSCLNVSSQDKICLIQISD